MTRNIYTVQAIPMEVCVCQLHFYLIGSMWGRIYARTLECLRISVKYNGRILKFIGYSFGL